MAKYTLTDKSVNNSKNSIEGQYQKLEIDRESYLQRARESAELTIPHLYPPKGYNANTEYSTPYQSVGSRGVMNLASKLMLALFPPQAPFFRIDVDDLVYKKTEGDPEQKKIIEQALAKIEKSVMDNIEVQNDRVAVFQALKDLIVSGNVLLHLTDTGLRVYRLENYVVKRDPQGEVQKIIIKEGVSPDVLPKDIQEKLKYDNQETEVCDLYTCIMRVGKKYRVHQEVKGNVLYTKEYTKDNLPYIALRFNRIDGMNYGRGHVETFIGDLKSLEGLTRAILEGSSASAKMLFMVSPNGTTRSSSLAKAPNGAIIEGSASDVSVLQANKFADFRVAMESMQRIEQRLQFAFLLNASVQRQAERVTATEVQLIANELQDALGGVYGILTTEFQLPYINTKLAMLRQKKLLPNLPKDIVKVKIIVGMEALGRQSDRLKLLQFLSDMAQTLGAEVLTQHINVTDAIKKFAIANQIDIQGLIKSEQQLAQEQQQAQMMAQQQQAMSGMTDPRTMIEAGKSLQQSGANVGFDPSTGEVSVDEPQ
tara:strand:- start:8486 stop:10099 length:1614 start_codon:yes stop_codon:yes gene_type:complete